MQHLIPAMSSSWRSRLRALVYRVFHLALRDTRSFVVWAEMHPIDYEGEDTSLTERDLQVMK